MCLRNTATQINKSNTDKNYKKMENKETITVEIKAVAEAIRVIHATRNMKGHNLLFEMDLLRKMIGKENMTLAIAEYSKMKCSK